MLDPQKHRIALLQILKAIYQDLSLSNLLGFKGGTACYLFYQLPRFSVDLDFDLLDSQQAEAVYARLPAMLSQHGTITDQAHKHYTLFFHLSYASGFSKIKIEISKRPTASAYELKHYLGVPMQVMKQADLFANKLLALTGRKQIAGRDIFDVWFFLKNQWALNTDLIVQQTGQPLESHLKDCISVIEATTPKRIMQDIGDLLEGDIKDWVKKQLKEEVLFLLKATFTPTALVA